MLNMIIPRLPDLTSLQLNRNVVLMSMSASSLLGNFRLKKYQFPRLEINDVYFLKVCVFVLINLSIITFFESFIIISSESLYQLNSRIIARSPLLWVLRETERERESERVALKRWWNWRGLKTINLNYSETNTSVKYQVDQDESRKISDSSSQLFPVIPKPWTNRTWYFFSQDEFLFSFHDKFCVFHEKVGRLTWTSHVHKVPKDLFKF